MFTGAMIPNWLLCRREISPGAKLAYARLVQYAGRGGRCFPKQESIALELGVSARTIRTYLRELIDFSLLEGVRNGLGTSNNYYFLDHPWIHENPSFERRLSGAARKGSSVPDRKSSSAPSSEEIQKEENHLKEHTLQVSDLPDSEEQAVQWGGMEGVPDTFCRSVFNRLAGVNWLDGCHRPITSWRPYIKSRWAQAQAHPTDHTHRQRRLTSAKPAPPRHYSSANYNQPTTNF